MKITNSVCETNLNREWQVDFEFDQGGRILQWENLKSQLATPFKTLVFDRLTSNGWGGKSPFNLIELTPVSPPLSGKKRKERSSVSTWFKINELWQLPDHYCWMSEPWTSSNDTPRKYFPNRTLFALFSTFSRDVEQFWEAVNYA